MDLVVWMQVGAKARTDARGNRHARKASSGSLTEANIVNGNGYFEERDQNGGKDCCQPPRRRTCCIQPDGQCTENCSRNADSTRQVDVPRIDRRCSPPMKAMSSILTQHSQDGPDSKRQTNREDDHPANDRQSAPVSEVRHGSAHNTCKTDGREYFPRRGYGLAMRLCCHASTLPQNIIENFNPVAAVDCASG